MTNRTPEEIQNLDRLHKELELKIQEYQEALNPGQIVLDWVMLTHRSSMELAQQSRKAFGITVAEGQSFIATRGLLEAAVDIGRADLVRSFTGQGG